MTLEGTAETRLQADLLLIRIAAEAERGISDVVDAELASIVANLIKAIAKAKRAGEGYVSIDDVNAFRRWFVGCMEIIAGVPITDWELPRVHCSEAEIQIRELIHARTLLANFCEAEEVCVEDIRRVVHQISRSEILLWRTLLDAGALVTDLDRDSAWIDSLIEKYRDRMDPVRRAEWLRDFAETDEDRVWWDKEADRLRKIGETR